MNRHYKTIGIACLGLVAILLVALALDSMLLVVALALGGAVLFSLLAASTMGPGRPTRGGRESSPGSR